MRDEGKTKTREQRELECDALETKLADPEDEFTGAHFDGRDPKERS